MWDGVYLEGELFHIHSFSNEKKVQRVLKKYPCFGRVEKKKKKRL